MSNRTKKTKELSRLLDEKTFNEEMLQECELELKHFEENHPPITDTKAHLDDFYKIQICLQSEVMLAKDKIEVLQDQIVAVRQELLELHGVLAQSMLENSSSLSIYSFDFLLCICLFVALIFFAKKFWEKA